MLVTSLANAHPDGKFLIVPHEPAPEQIAAIQGMLKVPSVLYSEASGADLEKIPVLIVDRVGNLARLYRYGFAAYVGAGFTTDCPHSVIEPAAYGIPVSVGPRYYQNPHFVELLEAGAGFSFSTPEQIGAWYDRLLADPAMLAKTGAIAKRLCEDGRGASDKILDVIFG